MNHNPNISKNKGVGQTHNLDISKYKFQELLVLFDLPQNILDIKPESLKNAKRKYQMVHPDKSGLDMSYFLFYQRAYNIIEKEYAFATNQSQKLDAINSPIRVPTKPLKYEINSQKNMPDSIDERTMKQIRKTLDKMSAEEFNQHLNKTFDEQMAKKQSTVRADFLRDEKGIFDISGLDAVKTPEQIAIQMEKIRQNSQSLVNKRPTTLVPIHTFTQSQGGKYYDDDSEEEDAEYISSDPFSKLRFEDIRKVHGAETILLEGSDTLNTRNQRDLDQMKKEISKKLEPMGKTQSDKYFVNKQMDDFWRTEKSRQASALKTHNYAERNDAFLRGILRIGN